MQFCIKILTINIMYALEVDNNTEKSDLKTDSKFY